MICSSSFEWFFSIFKCKGNNKFANLQEKRAMNLIISGYWLKNLKKIGCLGDFS